MKMLPFYFFLLLGFPSAAQQLELFGGLGVNSFYDKGQDDWHQSSTYKTGLAKCLGVGFFKKTGLGFDMGLTLKLMEIQGGIEIESNSLGAGYKSVMNTHIKSLEFGLFPVRFKPLKSNIEIQLGIEFASWKVGRLKGETSSRHQDLDISVYPPIPISVHETKVIDTKSSDYFNKLTSSLCVKIGYAIKFARTMELAPRLHLGYGLGKKFTEELNARPKNRVALLEISLRKSFAKSAG